MDSDKIMILDSGSLIEYGSPHLLVNQPSSYLCMLVNKSGSANATSWVDPLFCLGSKRSLEFNDLYAHPSEADSNYLLNKFNNIVHRFKAAKMTDRRVKVMNESTLLQCLLKELPALQGSVVVNGSIGYASQEAWVFSATVRDNILFGLPYNVERYNSVIEACALTK
uniref:ABC transporter domain-containing protein n=1 Tax=Amphimedon queenslandica TaxID=400682 RepID=A0A1X7USF3_AMPQE